MLYVFFFTWLIIIEVFQLNLKNPHHNFPTLLPLNSAILMRLLQLKPYANYLITTGIIQVAVACIDPLSGCGQVWSCHNIEMQWSCLTRCCWDRSLHHVKRIFSVDWWLLMLSVCVAFVSLPLNFPIWFGWTQVKLLLCNTQHWHSKGAAVRLSIGSANCAGMWLANVVLLISE